MGVGQGRGGGVNQWGTGVGGNGRNVVLILMSFYHVASPTCSQDLLLCLVKTKNGMYKQMLGYKVNYFFQ